MFQETTAVLSEQNSETVEQAINFGAVGWNIGMMILGAAVCLSGYAFKTKNTAVATRPWLRENINRFVVGIVLVVSLSIAMVVAPEQAAAALTLLAMDAKNMAAPFVLGVGFGFLLITVTSEPSKNPEGK